MTAHDELKRKLTDAGLSAVAEQLVRLARPCYRISYTLETEDRIAIGASKFGGSPDVPAGFTWPEVHNVKKPEPMEFVGQIRLADLPEPLPESVPRQGLFSFFTRWPGGRVFYFPEGAPLQRIEGPYAPVEPAPTGFWQSLRAGLKSNRDPRHTYRAGSLSFAAALSPPDGNSSVVAQLNLSEADAETYIEFCETLWPARSPGEVLKHQMFGHADPVQNEMELECQFQRSGEKPRWDLPPERFIDASRDWVLLLQADSDDGKAGPGWMWGDLGMVYFWIHRDDLAALSLERAIAIEQCH